MASNRFQSRPDDWPRSFYELAENVWAYHDFTWDRDEERYECGCGETHDELPEDAVTDRPDVGEELERRSRIVRTDVKFSFRRSDSEMADKTRTYRYHVPFPSQLDDYRVVDRGIRGLGFAEPEMESLPPTDPSTHRSGTCFDNESEEMRGACVDSIGAYLGADEAIHEARHQRDGYHTDLVYAIVDHDALEERDILGRARERNNLVLLPADRLTHFQTIYHELGHLAIHRLDEDGEDVPTTSEPFCSIFSIARMPPEYIEQDFIAYLGTPAVPKAEWPEICRRALSYREHSHNYIQQCKAWLEIDGERDWDA